jgi:CHAT domain-containing protein
LLPLFALIGQSDSTAQIQKANSVRELTPLTATVSEIRLTSSSADKQIRRDDAAAGLFSAAQALHDSWTEDKIRQAIKLYEQASIAWHELGHLHEAARSLEYMAECHFMLGDYPGALVAFKRALAESRAARDERGEYRTLNGIGMVLVFIGDSDEVIANVELVLAGVMRPGDPTDPEDLRIVARALCNKGEAYYNLGRLPDALKLFERALALWTQTGDRAGQALAKLNIGYALADSGETLAAGESHRQALLLWQAAAHRRGEALSLTAIGGIHSSLDETRLALKSHQQAKQIFETLGDRRGLAVVLNNLGRTHELLNEFDEAREHYTSALNIYRELRSPNAEALSLLYLGRLYRSRGKTEDAFDYCNQSIRISRKMDKVRLEAYALIEIAAIEHGYGRTQKALGIYQRLLGIYKRTGDSRGRAKTLNQMGKVYYKEGRTRRAVECFEQALALSQKVKDRAEETLLHYNLALAARDLGHTERALTHATASVDLSEAAREQTGNAASRSSFFAAARKYYELQIELLMKMDQDKPGTGFAVRALGVSEGAHARSLLDLLTEMGANIRHGVDSSLLERERSLQRALAGKAQYLTRLLSSEVPPPSAKDVEEEIRQLTKKYRELQSDIRDQSPRYETLTKSQPLTLEEIQKELSNNTILLEYILGPEKSYLWAIDGNSFAAHELPSRARIEKAADDVYQLLKTRPADDGSAEFNQGYVQVATVLSEMLLGKVADRLNGKRLLIVADGNLHYIPFEALPQPVPSDSTPDSFVPLVTQHEVAYLPSASLLSVIRREAARRHRAAKTVLVLADPVFEADDPRVKVSTTTTAYAGNGAKIEKTRLPRLRFTRDEVEAIMSMTPHGQGGLVTGFDANRATALGDLPLEFQAVHFSTHARIDRENPEMSGIVLSMINREGLPENGFLQLHDIYNLNLSAELVVISACDSGLGEDIKGEGLVGLTRGFMYAGSRSVVASLWQVDDAATAELMTHFYREMLAKGAMPTAALRAAKVAVWQQKGRSAPYFWAAFVFQGDLDSVVKVGPAEPLNWSRMLVIFFTVLAAVVVTHRLISIRSRRF